MTRKGAEPMGRWRLLVVSASTVLVLASVTPGAMATYPGRNGKLAAELHSFGRAGELAWEIVVMKPSTRRDLRHVSPCNRLEKENPSDPEYDEYHRGSCPHDPCFSPDGEKLAFELDGQLAVAGASGARITTMRRFTDRDSDPYWSPDGSRLVFTGKRHGTSNLFLVKADGTGLEQLTFSGGRTPAWSRDGRIAYASSGQLYLLDISSRRPVRLARGSHPDWAPSGRSLAYEVRGNAYRIRARRHAQRRLLRRRARRPVFSPDGRRLAFSVPVRGDARGSRSLYVAPVGGGRVKRLGPGGEQPEGNFWDAYLSATWQPLR